ncbi:MAG: hypothetical protein RLT87_02460 [Gammaproteobacteria bacterium]
MTDADNRDAQLREAIDTVSQAFSDGRHAEALLLLRPLADAGVAEAIGMLALAYQRGAGLEADGEKAIELFLKAIDMGDAVAAYHLGMLYKTGMPGIEVNLKLGEEYLQRANEMGLELPAQ